jgi:hypothetical protein
LSSLSTSSGNEDFATTFANAVHGGLDKILGQSGSTAVLSHMKVTNNLPDPAEFHKKLLVLFGEQATISLERAIVRDLILRLKWALDLLSIEGTFDFNATMLKIQKGMKK